MIKIANQKMEFPTEEYTHEIGSHKFKIKPLSEKEKDILNELDELGANVRLFPNDEEPTSIFVSYDERIEPVEAVNYYIVGVELKLHLYLLINNGKYVERLEKFLKDIKKSFGEESLPKGSLKNVKYVQIINEYEY